MITRSTTSITRSIQRHILNATKLIDRQPHMHNNPRKMTYIIIKLKFSYSRPTHKRLLNQVPIQWLTSNMLIT